MSTRKQTDPTDRWTLADWAREFGDGSPREYKARHETTDYNRLRASPHDDWDADDDDLDDAVASARKEVEKARFQLDADRMALELLEYKGRAAERQAQERQQRALEREVKRQTAEARLETMAAAYLAKLKAQLRQPGDTEWEADARVTQRLAEQHRERTIRWRADQATAREYYAAVKAAQAAHEPPPPHYQHAAKAYAKWRESQRLKQFAQFDQPIVDLRQRN